ncbi:MAG: HD domain-containing protein [Candidatus Omnitrophica bacterium]|nr:HD domain-containing protein [Candidatus Omnitrophota bacterium]
MIKISDIFDKHKKNKIENKEKAKDLISKTTDAPVSYSEGDQESVSLQVINITTNLIDLALKIYKPNALNLDLINKLKNCINMLVEFKNLEDDFLKVFFKDYPEDSTYLVYHIANTSILSLEVAKTLKYDNERLFYLGLGAFLHKIGLTTILDITLEDSQLEQAKSEKIKTHPLVGSKILKEFEKEFDSTTIKIVEQSFERIDKSGYPLGIDEPIPEAQIVNIVQVYESLVHKRNYREKFNPLKAMKIIIEDKGFVNNKIKKALIERVGFYPPNTLVLLNTKEEAIVIATNFKNPLRPIVKKISTQNKIQITEPKIINLAKDTHFYIEKILTQNGQ